MVNRGNTFYYAPTNASDDKLRYYVYETDAEHFVGDGLVFLLIGIMVTNIVVGIPTNAFLSLGIVFSSELKIWRFTFIFIHAVSGLLICSFHNTAVLTALTKGWILKQTCESAGLLGHMALSFMLMSKALAGVMQIINIRSRKQRQLQTKLLHYGSGICVVLILAFGLVLTLPEISGSVDVAYIWDRDVASCFFDRHDDFAHVFARKGKGEEEQSSPQRRVTATIGISIGIMFTCLIVSNFYMTYAFVDIWRRKKDLIRPVSLLQATGLVSIETSAKSHKKMFADEKVGTVLYQIELYYVNL